MKRLLSCVLVLVIAFPLAGCYTMMAASATNREEFPPYAVTVPYDIVLLPAEIVCLPITLFLFDNLFGRMDFK